jgi:hypothetical protein
VKSLLQTDTGAMLDALAGIEHGAYGAGFPCPRCQLPRLALSTQDPGRWSPLWEGPAAAMSEDGERVICLRCCHETPRAEVLRLVFEDSHAY